MNRSCDEDRLRPVYRLHVPAVSAGRCDADRGLLTHVTVEEAQKPGSLLGDRDGGVDGPEAEAGSRRGVEAELRRDPDDVGERPVARRGRGAERVWAARVAAEGGDGG